MATTWVQGGVVDGALPGADAITAQLSEALERPGVVVLDVDALLPEVERLAAAAPGIELVCLTELGLREALEPLMRTQRLRHLVGVGGAHWQQDLALTLRLVDQRALGLGALEEQIEARSVLELGASSQIIDALGAADAFFGGLGVADRLVSEFITAIDEALTNAFFNAPVDEQGRHCFSERHRTEVVTMPPGKVVRAEFLRDAGRIYFEVCDAYGSLGDGDFYKYLARTTSSVPTGVADKKGGAGLGLFMMYQQLSHLVLDVERGRCTRVVGVCDRSASYRKVREQARSLNFFSR